jgi:hypothetical protein
MSKEQCSTPLGDADPNAMDYTEVVAKDRVERWERGDCIASTTTCTGDEYRLAKALLRMRSETAALPSAELARSEGFEDWWRRQKYFDLFEDSDAKIFARNAWCAAQSATAQIIPDFEGLIDNAAGASQSRELLDDPITRAAVKANVYDRLIEIIRRADSRTEQK